MKSADMTEAEHAEYNEYMKKYMLERYYRRIAEVYAALGGKCCKCGVVDEFEIDHIDPSTKEFSVGRCAGSVSQKKLDAEVAKCQLLCRDCHESKTLVDLGRVSAKITHGTLSSYKYCRCDLCKQAKSDYMKEYAKTHTRKHK